MNFEFQLVRLGLRGEEKGSEERRTAGALPEVQESKGEPHPLCDLEPLRGLSKLRAWQEKMFLT